MTRNIRKQIRLYATFDWEFTINWRRKNLTKLPVLSRKSENFTKYAQNSLYYSTILSVLTENSGTNPILNRMNHRATFISAPSTFYNKIRSIDARSFWASVDRYHSSSPSVWLTVNESNKQCQMTNVIVLSNQTSRTRFDNGENTSTN